MKSQEDILIALPLVMLALCAVGWALINQLLMRTRLQDQVRVLSQAIEQGPATVMITDQDGKIEYVNRAFTSSMGYQLDEVQGQTPAVINSGLMRSHVYLDLWSTITRGQVWQGDLLNRSKDGKLCWMSAAISGVHDETGTIRHYVSVEYDVSERRALDQQVTEFRQMADGLLTLPVILYRVDADGAVVDARGAGLDAVGLNAQAILNQPHDEVFPGLRGPFLRALHGETIRCEGTIKIGDQQIWLDHILAPAPRAPETAPNLLITAPLPTKSVIGIALDVTARHLAEERLSDTIENLNASNRELEQFAYVASHDLQEPLRIVSSYLSLLKRRYGDKLGDDADSFINYAVDGAHRMQSLILDLLQLSRIGVQGKDLEPVPLSGIVSQAIANLDLAIADAGAVVSVGVLPTVTGDKPQLLRLFQNLISNALKYRHPDRPLHVVISASRNGPLWHLLVEDNGQGIDEPFREKVFLIFQRLHTREQAEGNGIGLAVCRKVVERHGGTIWIDGDASKGTRIHFTIPCTEEQAHTDPYAATIPVQLTHPMPAPAPDLQDSADTNVSPSN